MRVIVLAVMIAAAAPRALAYDIDSDRTADYLGAIVGSERLCGLTFDPAALSAFIAGHVRADDIEFAAHLERAVFSLRMSDRDITEGEKIARCAQVKRNAESFGFLKR